MHNNAQYICAALQARARHRRRSNSPRHSPGVGSVNEPTRARVGGALMPLIAPDEASHTSRRHLRYRALAGGASCTTPIAKSGPCPSTAKSGQTSTADRAAMPTSDGPARRTSGGGGLLHDTARPARPARHGTTGTAHASLQRRSRRRLVQLGIDAHRAQAHTFQPGGTIHDPETGETQSRQTDRQTETRGSIVVAYTARGARDGTPWGMCAIAG